MKAKVNQDICIGCGLCPSVCPEVFSMDDDIDKAVAISGDVPEDEEGAAEDARDSCPVSAIDIE